MQNELQIPPLCPDRNEQQFDCIKSECIFWLRGYGCYWPVKNPGDRVKRQRIKEGDLEDEG